MWISVIFSCPTLDVVKVKAMGRGQGGISRPAQKERRVEPRKFRFSILEIFRLLFLLNLPVPNETIGQPHPLPGKASGMPTAAHPDVLGPRIGHYVTAQFALDPTGSGYELRAGRNGRNSAKIPTVMLAGGCPDSFISYLASFVV
jgi:hypothetical protein